MESMRTFRFDLFYLRSIVAEATNLYLKITPEERVTLEVLHDFLSWLTIEAMMNKAQAKRLVSTMARLQEELHTKTEIMKLLKADTTPTAYYEGFLHGLEQAISFSHGVDLLLNEEINQEDFLKTWEQTEKKLSLQRRKHP